MVQHTSNWEFNLKILTFLKKKKKFEDSYCNSITWPKGLASMILAVRIISLTEQFNIYFFIHLLGNNLSKNFEAKQQHKEFTAALMCT